MELIDILGWTTSIASVIVMVACAIYMIIGLVYLAYIAIDNWRFNHRRK